MFLTLVIRNGLPNEMVSIGPERDAETQHFLGACKTNVSNFDDYSPDDISAVLDDGYCEFGNGAVCLLDLTNTEGYQTATRCVVEINGGNVQCVWGDSSLAVRLLDWDNLKAGDEFKDFTPQIPTWNGPDGSIQEFIKGRPGENALSSLQEALELSRRNAATSAD